MRFKPPAFHIPVALVALVVVATVDRVAEADRSTAVAFLVLYRSFHAVFNVCLQFGPHEHGVGWAWVIKVAFSLVLRGTFLMCLLICKLNLVILLMLLVPLSLGFQNTVPRAW